MYSAKQRYQDTEYAENYDRRRFSSLFGRIAHALDMRALDRATARCSKGALFLDVPCGTGRLLSHLAMRGFRVVGADVSREMIQVARRKEYAGNLERFVVSEAEKLPFPDRYFDHVTSGRFLAHLPPESRITVLKEFARVSKGVIIVGYHVHNAIADISRFIRTRGNVRHFKLSRVPLADALKEIQSAGFQVVETVKLIPMLHDYRYFVLRRIDRS